MEKTSLILVLTCLLIPLQNKEIVSTTFVLLQHLLLLLIQFKPFQLEGKLLTDVAL